MDLERLIQRKQKGGVSKVKLALGAAGLFLFIVGLKRTFEMDEAAETAKERDEGAEG